jgi:hypothetical protein
LYAGPSYKENPSCVPILYREVDSVVVVVCSVCCNRYILSDFPKGDIGHTDIFDMQCIQPVPRLIRVAKVRTGMHELSGAVRAAIERVPEPAWPSSRPSLGPPARLLPLRRWDRVVSGIFA